MKVYISGPITALLKQGWTQEAVAKDWERSAQVLREMGHEPVFPPNLLGTMEWHEALKEDFIAVSQCDAIYYRKGWRNSTGVRRERFIARSLQLQEMYEDPNEQMSGSERFHQILEGLGELHDKKQRDYGTTTDPFANVRASTEFAVPAWIGSILRGNDKMARIKSFIRNGRLENESLTDSLRDLAVYAVIALVLWEEEHAA